MTIGDPALHPSTHDFVHPGGIGWRSDLCGLCQWDKCDHMDGMLARLRGRLTAREKVLDELDDFLRRLGEWDHLEGAADGPYWRREIAKMRAAIDLDRAERTLAAHPPHID